MVRLKMPSWSTTTPTPIPQPPSKEDRKLYFSFEKKKSRYAMKTQVVIGLDLKIWHVSSTYRHSIHDLTILGGSGALELISAEKKGLGDSAYISEPNVIVPFKKPPRRQLTRAQKLFNKQLSHVRITAENTFKRV